MLMAAVAAAAVTAPPWALYNGKKPDTYTHTRLSCLFLFYIIYIYNTHTHTDIIIYYDAGSAVAAVAAAVHTTEKRLDSYTY